MNDLKILTGRTEVRVMRKNINEQTRRESVDQIHEGIVVQNLGAFVRVFNPMSPEKGGDVSQVNAEIFPVTSKRCWIEPVGERSESRTWPIAPELRF
jgi:hypothetical protein